MSSFVMLPQGFNVLANELALRAESSNSTCDINYSITRDVRAFLGFESHRSVTEEVANQKAFAATLELFRANVEAVTQRYADMTEEERGFYPDPTFTRSAYWPQWTPTQLLKHLTCLRYQMSEGNVPESDAYTKLTELINAVSFSIAISSPDYDKAAWDFAA